MSFIKHKVLLVLLVFIVIICGVTYINYSLEKNSNDEVIITLSEENKNSNQIIQQEVEQEVENQENPIKEKKKVVVHVCGAIINPNKLYKLESGSRVADAINIAGGATNEADLSKINLADIIEDGQKIYIPSYGEMKQQIDLFEKNDQIQGINENNSLININTASKIELKQLSGIGEVKATSIIEYRNKNNGFKSIEEIIKVTGIGQATFEKIEEKIIIN